MVSVIIPCYNSEKWIKECLRSVINQTYRDLEILVIDDGSTDNSACIIKSIDDPRIHYFYKTNEGHSSARNYGLKKATGKWIALLDADDAWIKTKLEIKLANCEGYDIVFSDFNIVNEDGEFIEETHNINPEKYNYNYKREILGRNIISGGSCIVLRKEVTDYVGEFNTNLIIGEDWDYWARAIWANYKLKFIDKKLTNIKRHSKSTQKTTDDQAWANSIELTLKSFLSLPGLSDKDISFIYKKLTMVAYRFNLGFTKFSTFYFNCIGLDKKMIFDYNLVWLTIKFPIRHFLKKGNV